MSFMNWKLFGALIIARDKPVKMSLLDRFGKRKPTAEQSMLLAKITNFQQQKALRSAIAKGEEIPDYAWIPVPENVDCAQRYRLFQEEQADFRRREEEAGTTLEAMIEIDRQGTVDAMDDEAQFLEIATAAKERISKVQAELSKHIVDYIYRIMGIDQQWSVRETDGFIWWGHRLAQRIWTEPVISFDGTPCVRLHAQTDMLFDLPDEIDMSDALTF
jgi:hypothetical protein